MDRGAWLATVHRVAKSQTQATEHTRMMRDISFSVIKNRLLRLDQSPLKIS